jgi:hypothetical protein
MTTHNVLRLFFMPILSFNSFGIGCSKTGTKIIVAALPIADSLRAEELVNMLEQIINGRLDHKIQVVSYTCDGTLIERKV